MPHTLTWYTTDQLLYLNLQGDPSTDELQAINQEVHEQLDACDTPISILLDASNLETNYWTANHLRTTQQYIHHPLISGLYVVAENKLNRLIMLIAFGTFSAQFIHFTNLQKAIDYLQYRGFLPTGDTST